jgi:formamidopyrimidine-DNA glycosylase
MRAHPAATITSHNRHNTHMPELPEVETTRRGIAAAVTGQVIENVIVREARLRWRLPDEFAVQLARQRIRAVDRRAKYLLLQLDRGALIAHLGMSGSLRVMPANAPALKHDHIDIVLSSGNCLRFNDPRRFGSMHYTVDDPTAHPLLRKLAPEPLNDDFNANYLASKARRRKVAIKQFIMNGNLVVGVGNIYASEALFRAGIRPSRATGRVRRDEFVKLAKAIKAVLSDAIRAGGTTLRDYVNSDGMPGYFRQKLFVYERAGEPCRKCKTPIKQLRHGQRSTYYCPQCQR